MSDRYIFGEPGENRKESVILQPDDHSCALRSQQIILRNFGIDIPFENLEAIAKEYTHYSENGTPIYEIGKVMELLGVPVHQAVENSVNDLARELSQGHNIIVAVDADELWHNGTISEKLYNSLKDHIMPNGANHALIVAGIEVNPNDTTDIKVVLTDPGSGDLRIEYPADQFIDAWKDGSFFMAATDNPAPYQYDAETGMEVPSNFAVEQHINQYIAEHSWQLSADKVNMPYGYQPSFAGHLPLGELGVDFQENTDCAYSSDSSDYLPDNSSMSDNSAFSGTQETNFDISTAEGQEYSDSHYSVDALENSDYSVDTDSDLASDDSSYADDSSDI